MLDSPTLRSQAHWLVAQKANTRPNWQEREKLMKKYRAKA